MKKLFTFAAVALLIGTMTYGANTNPVIPGTVRIAASQGTNTSSDIWIGEADGSIGAREIEEFSVINYSGTGTGTVTLLMIDGGIETTIYNAGALIPGASVVVYPQRTVTEASVAGYGVTNYPVAFYTAQNIESNDALIAVGTATNYYMQTAQTAVTATTTKYVPYRVRQAKVRITQPNAAAVDVYNWVIKTK